MRYLAWFTLGFCGLCALWAYLPLWTAAVAVGLFGVSLLLVWKKNKVRRILLTVLVGILAGSFWFSLYQLGLRDVQALDGRTAAGTVTFLEDSQATASGQSVRCRLDAEEGRATVRLFLYSGEKLKAGTTCSGRFRLRRDETGNYAGRRDRRQRCRCIPGCEAPFWTCWTKFFPPTRRLWPVACCWGTPWTCRTA